MTKGVNLFFLLLSIFSYVYSQTTCDYRIDMFDSYGDGWDGATITIWDCSRTTILYSNLTCFASQNSATLCLNPSNGFTVVASGGTDQSENSWRITRTTNNLVVMQGDAPYFARYNCSASSICSNPSTAWTIMKSGTTSRTDTKLTLFDCNNQPIISGISLSSSGNETFCNTNGSAGFYLMVAGRYNTTNISWSLISPTQNRVLYGQVPYYGGYNCQDGCRFRIGMFDTYGDGWNANRLSVRGCNQSVVIASATLLQETSGSSSLCVPFNITGYNITVNGGSYPNEVFWILSDVNGKPTIGGGSPYSGTYNCTTSCPSGQSRLTIQTAANGRGWNGNRLSVSDCSGRSIHWNLTVFDDFQGEMGFCIPSTSGYRVTVTGGSAINDSIWYIRDSNGNFVASGGAPFSRSYNCPECNYKFRSLSFSSVPRMTIQSCDQTITYTSVTSIGSSVDVCSPKTGYTIIVNATSFNAYDTWTLSDTNGVVVLRGGIPYYGTFNCSTCPSNYLTVQLNQSVHTTVYDNNVMNIFSCNNTPIAVGIVNNTCIPKNSGFYASVVGGTNHHLVSWNILDSDSTSIARGGAPFFGGVNCSNNCNFRINLVDAYGDGWQSNKMDVKSCDGSQTFINGITLSSGRFLSSSNCVPQSNGYQISVYGGFDPQEISWTFADNQGRAVVSGGAPYTAYYNCSSPCSSSGYSTLLISDPQRRGWQGNTLTVTTCSGQVLHNKISIPPAFYGTLKVCLVINSGVRIIVGGGNISAPISYTLFDSNQNLVLQGFLPGNKSYACQNSTAPCECSADGVSNGVVTNRPGCGIHAGPEIGPICYVSSECDLGHPSIPYPGAYWRVCGTANCSLRVDLVDAKPEGWSEGTLKIMNCAQTEVYADLSLVNQTYDVKQICLDNNINGFSIVGTGDEDNYQSYWRLFDIEGTQILAGGLPYTGSYNCSNSTCIGDGWEIILTDTGGNGWEGNFMTVYDCSNNIIYSGITLFGGSKATVPLCVPDTVFGVYVSVLGGFNQSEVGWQIFDSNKNLLLEGGAPYFGGVNCAENCGFKIAMSDRVGDGWNENTFLIKTIPTDTDVNPTFNSFNITMVDGDKYAVADICLPNSPNGYSIEVDGGQQQDEIFWILTDSFGKPIIGGGAPYHSIFNSTTSRCSEYFVALHDDSGVGWEGNKFTISNCDGFPIISNATVFNGLETEHDLCLSGSGFTFSTTNGKPSAYVNWTLVYAPDNLAVLYGGLPDAEWNCSTIVESIDPLPTPTSSTSLSRSGSASLTSSRTSSVTITRTSTSSQSRSRSPTGTPTSSQSRSPTGSLTISTSATGSLSGSSGSSSSATRLTTQSASQTRLITQSASITQSRSRSATATRASNTTVATRSATSSRTSTLISSRSITLSPSKTPSGTPSTSTTPTVSQYLCRVCGVDDVNSPCQCYDGCSEKGNCCPNYQEFCNKGGISSESKDGIIAAAILTPILTISAGALFCFFFRRRSLVKFQAQVVPENHSRVGPVTAAVASGPSAPEANLPVLVPVAGEQQNFVNDS